jgi:hypothetical protein
LTFDFPLPPFHFLPHFFRLPSPITSSRHNSTDTSTNTIEMPAVTPEDELRMLYQIIKLTDAKPRMEDLAVAMGLKTATA